MSLVSVIIPTYKTAKYLPKCLDSVLNQTFQDFEIIIVSDGPEDDNLAADKYAQKDKRIVVLKDIKKGLGGARNAGMEAARGKYISFIDSDDWLEPTFLEKMINGVDNDVDIVQCGTNIVFEDNVDTVLKNADDTYFAINQSGTFNLVNDYFGKINVAAWNKLYKKDLIERYNLLFPEHMYNEDACFSWMYWSICKKINFIPEKLYNYLRRDTSLMALARSKNLGRNVLDHILINELIYDFLKNNNLLQIRKSALLNCLNASYGFVYGYADEKYLIYAKKLINEFIQKVRFEDCSELLAAING